MIILQQTRGLLSSNDQLSLDLPFAETKSLTARIGPTPVLTRASGATYIGSDGLIHGVDTSTTSNTIGTGSKSFTLTATAGQDQFWRTGDAVEATNGGNSMVGTVTSYTPSTQVLVCNITSIAGTGTFASWRIGYRGPRFDHNPVTIASRGLLIEESRTNLTWPSIYTTSNLGIGVFPTGSATTSFNQLSIGTDPNGAALIREAATTQVHGVYVGVVRSTTPGGIPIASGTIYTASIFVKADGRTKCRFSFNTSSNIDGIFATFDLSSSGSIITNSTTYGTGTSAAGISATITKHIDGWFRLSVSGSLSNTSSYVTVETLDDAGNRSYLGDTSKGLFIANAQLEAGSFATSYIPTTTASVVRSGDVCTISSTAFSNMWNRFAGTVIIRATNAGNNNSRWISTDVAQRTIDIYGKTIINNYESAGNSTTTIASSITLPATVGLAYEVNNYRSAYNGILGGVDTNTGGTLPNPTFLDIGRLNTIQQLCGCISFIRYYRKSLPNAKLQALTA